jgi:SAM-dependent methyltransferase
LKRIGASREEAMIDWEGKYERGETPWDAGSHCPELERIVREGWFAPGPAIELGCGTGADAVFLAAWGYSVTAVDVARKALERAADLARATGVDVRLIHRDVLAWPAPLPPVPFVLDNGLYHILRGIDLDRYRSVVAGLVEPGGHLLILAGNAGDPSPVPGGPPRVKAREICDEWERDFDLVQLREFKFHPVATPGGPVRPLGWSALLRRKGGPS